MTIATRVRALVLALGIVGVMAACTPAEHAAWLQWHAQDPAAAEAFAEEWKANHAAGATRAAPAVSNGSVWDRLAQCESGGDWHINTGNGYFGGLQFLASTWRANGGSGLPHENSREEQIRVAENLRETSGFAPWPACSKKLGLR